MSVKCRDNEEVILRKALKPHSYHNYYQKCLWYMMYPTVCLVLTIQTLGIISSFSNSIMVFV